MEEKESQSLEFIRCRFLHLYPSSIITLSYNPHRQWLAVGRENGAIQLFDSRSMMCIYQISGYKSKGKLILEDSLPICKLHWHGDRLIMTSFSGYAIEWDLKAQCARRNIMIDGGGVWDSHITSDSLIVACEDGAVRVIKLQKDQEFHISYVSIPQPARAISICGSSLNENFIYSGHSDGTLARWDCLKSKTATSLMKGSANSAPITAIVFVKKYQDKELVVAGDSKGSLSIWDCKNSVRLISFSTHRAAILTICQHSGTIYASGSDSLIVCLAESQAHRWKVQNSERAQSHDVLALQMIDTCTLVSGGITTDLCVHSLTQSGTFFQNYGNHDKNKHFRHVVGLSTSTRVMHSRAQQNSAFVAVNKSNSLQLFKLDSNYSEEFCGSFKFKGGQNISTFALKAISQSEVLIAISQITAFRNSAEVIYEQKLACPIRKIYFGSHYLYTLDCVANLTRFKLSVSMTVKKQDQRRLLQEESSTLLLHAEFSPNQDYLCLLCEENKLQIIDLESFKDYQFALPSVKNNLASCINFTSTRILLVTYSNNQIIAIDPLFRKLTNWSIEYSFALPRTLLTWYNKSKGCCSINDHKVLLFSHNGFFTVDFREPPPKVAKFVRHQLVYKARQQILNEEEQWYGALEQFEKLKSATEKQKSLKLKPFEINTQNFGILGIEKLNDSQILIYECDFSKMVKSFPKTLKLKKYGF